MKRLSRTEIQNILRREKPEFYNCIIENYDFSNTDLSNVIIKNCKISLCRFINTKITHWSIEDSNFSYCEFIESDIRNTDFIKCSFSNCTFGRSVCYNIRFLENKIINTYFTNLKANNLVFNLCFFINKISFENAIIRNGFFSDCRYSSTNESKANFLNCSMKSIEFNNCKRLEPNFILLPNIENIIKKMQNESDN